MKISTAPSRLALLSAWLCFESVFDAWMGLYFIPNLYGVKTFQTTTQFSIRKCEGLAKQNELTQNVSAQIDAARDCMKSDGTKLSDTVNWQLFHKEGRHFANILNGLVLLVCGFLAPCCEMLFRATYNVFYLCNLRKHCPCLFDGFEYVYVTLKDVLRHFSQFKLYLLFLQILLTIKLLGVDLVLIEPGPGMEDFVKFVLWSIFLNCVVKKVEVPIKKGEPLIPAILPNSDWVDTVLAPKRVQSTTMISLVQLVGFYFWMTLPVFTMIFKFTPQKPGHEPHEVKYYSESLLPIHVGLSKLHRHPLMWALLCFQLLWCNIAAAVFQLVSAIVKEWHEWFPRMKEVRASEPFKEGLVERGFLDDEPSLSRQVVSLALQTFVENQSHEFFLCAMAMMLYVMSSMLESNLLWDANHVDAIMGKDVSTSCGESGLELRLCFNPVICLWLLFSVVSLGLPRASLYSKSIGQECRMLTVQVVMALAVFYFLVFHDTQIWKYFGDWTVQMQYVTDFETRGPFNCLTHGQLEKQCVLTDNRFKLRPFLYDNRGWLFSDEMNDPLSGLLNASFHCLDLPAISQQPLVESSIMGNGT